MCSAVPRFPRSSTLFTSCVTSALPYTGSSTTSRFWIGPFLGISSLVPLSAQAVPSTARRAAGFRSGAALRAVFRARLFPVSHTGCVQRGADDLVADTRQVLHAAAAHEHDRVLLQVVTDTGDVRVDLRPAGQAHARDFAKRRVRLLRRHRKNARADAPSLRRALQRGRL